jgi:hypothetical protein
LQQLVVWTTNNGAETFRFDAPQCNKLGNNRLFYSIVCPVQYFVSQIRGSGFDLNQIGPEKLNWIEVPSSA